MRVLLCCHGNSGVLLRSMLALRTGPGRGGLVAFILARCFFSSAPPDASKNHSLVVAQVPAVSFSSRPETSCRSRRPVSCLRTVTWRPITRFPVICQSEYRRSYGRSRSVSPQPGDALAHGKAGSREGRLGDERRCAPAAGARANSASVVTARNKENNRKGTPGSAGSDPPLRQRPQPVAGRAHSRAEKAERLHESASGIADDAASPLLTAQQMLRPCGREASSFRWRPVAMETKAQVTEPQSRPLSSESEYRRNFRGASPPRGPPRLRKHLESRQRVPLSDTRGSQRMRKESEMMPHPQHAGPASQSEATAPPQLQRQHRNLLTEYEANFPFPQCGDTGESPQVMLLREKARWYRRRAWGTNFSRQHLSQLKSQHNILWEPDGGGGGARRPASVPRAEAQDSASRPREDGEDDKGAGRFPTPEKYGGPLHRSHLDLTTPTCGGGMLVGRATSRDAFQRRGDPHAELPPEGPAASRPSSAPPPTRVIRGLLRHAEFQHNGELGLRFRSYAAGPLCPDRDVAWSRSLAAAVLERARSRPRQFWGRS
ncbi:nuclear protein MDM1 isoform X2 [Syngnathus typhle]|uniref:nuclear protein MDM1 isoform X2 n=1 Tax=Syngnathus typhle TaxID=161592 RepID=UPI002A6A1317|nr:nuclear protein MDM1 isoform X2 [Syngnathus typhle]